MRAVDTDVLVEILAGNSAFVRRAAAIPLEEQAVPVEFCRNALHGKRLPSLRKRS